MVQLQYMVRSLEEMMCMALWLEDEDQQNARKQADENGTEFANWVELTGDERYAFWTSFGFPEMRKEHPGGVSKFHGSLIQSIENPLLNTKMYKMHVVYGGLPVPPVKPMTGAVAHGMALAWEIGNRCHTMSKSLDQ